MTESNGLNLEKFTVFSGGARIVSFCCDVVLYTDRDLSSIPGAILHIYEKFLAACPPGTLRWYATENMTRHKPVTSRVLDVLYGWLKADAPRRKIINIHLKDGANFDDAPEYSFWVYGTELGDLSHGVDANNIRCTFPGRLGMESPTDLLHFVLDACTLFPFISGHAGLVLETSPYYRSAGHLAAWQLSMQHPGLDISNPITDPNRLRRDGIKGVNWLTMLGNEFANRIGGAEDIRQKLPESIDVLPVGGGAILRAGPAPRLGHLNRNDQLPDYHAVYKVVAPLQEPIIQRYTAFSLPGGDHKQKTTAWLRRFADGY